MAFVVRDTVEGASTRVKDRCRVGIVQLNELTAGTCYS